MTELTKEQITQAKLWALKVSKAKGSQYTPASKNAAAYILSSPPPSPPVSGEAVTVDAAWEAHALLCWINPNYLPNGALNTLSRFISQFEASASPLTNEPVGVTKPKCGIGGEISLPAMGLDYFYNPSDWEWTQNADDDSCIADWLSESMVDVMEIQTLIEGPLLFAANIPTKWDEDGEVTDSEVTYFDTEEDAKNALSAAIGERG